MSATKKFHLGTGRRKTSVARVRVTEGNGKIVVNERPLDQFFTEEKDRGAVIGPLALLDMRNRLDVFINVRGGGITGQAGAASQGVARAESDVRRDGAPTPRARMAQPAEGGIGKKLRDSGYLTRDSRMKERKKYGGRARRSFQFSKRNRRTN